MEGREGMISGFFLLPEICCLALVAGTEGSLGWAVNHPLLLLPFPSHELPIPCQLQATDKTSAPRLRQKKIFSCHPYPLLLDKHGSIRSNASFPFFWQMSLALLHVTAASRRLLLPCCTRNGLMVKNCSIKNGSKSLKKNSNSLMML